MREADRLLVSQGEVIFKGLCASCHGLDGKGVNNGTNSIAAPALAGNTDVNGDPRKLIAILLYGLNGPIHGKVYADAIMPSTRH